MKVSIKKLKKTITNFKGKRILVIGDLILDHYIFGAAERISPEAPVPVIWANKENFVGGGAVNVALNLVDLGVKVSLCGVIGDDHFGKALLSLIREKNIDTSLIFTDNSRPTTLKTRIISQHQQVVRLDWESKEFLQLGVNSQILKRLKKDIKIFDGVIIEDYGKGVINPYLVEELVNLSKKNNKIITVDPKEEHFDYYENVTALTPNLKEAETAANMRVRSKDEINLLGEVIIERLKPKALLVTMGDAGMKLFLEGGKIYHIPTYSLEVYDVTGAGDTVIAVFTASLLGGASFIEAAVISNFAASIVVSKVGAATITRRELAAKMKETEIKVFSYKA